MPLPQREDYTIEDIYALPEGTRAELIDGQIYYMAPPTRKHQDIVGALYRKIADYIDSKRGSCKIYVSPFAVFLSENDKNYVEPDISVICDPNKLNDKSSFFFCSRSRLLFSFHASCSPLFLSDLTHSLSSFCPGRKYSQYSRSNCSYSSGSRLFLRILNIFTFARMIRFLIRS